jgi:hypothetical protein
MNITAYVRLGKRKDKASIYFRVRDTNPDCDLKAASEFSINPAHWDSRKMGYKLRVTTISDAERLEFNSQIQDCIKVISKTYYKGATSEWLKKTIFCFHHPQAYKLEGTHCIEVRLIPIIEKYIESKDFDPRQRTLYSCEIGKIRRFEQYQRQVKKRKNFTMCVDTITSDDLKELHTYLIHEHEFFNLYPDMYKSIGETRPIAQRSGNTLHGIFARYRTIIRWAIRQGWTTNNPFDRFDLPKSVYGTPFYLSLEERDALHDCDLSDKPRLAMFRDMFFFQCCIGCRFGDLVRLKPGCVIDGMLEYIPHKTMKHDARTIRIPLIDKAKIIYDKFCERGTLDLFPHYNICDYNKAIREILTIAGITRCVAVIDPVTRMTVQKPINEIATSHTARKTFVGNLYKIVKDPNLISSMSGHANGSRAFARYRAIDDDIKLELIQHMK